MASKAISQLDPKTSANTDLIPVADPITGIAGKTTVLQARTGGASLDTQSVSANGNYGILNYSLIKELLTSGGNATLSFFDRIEGINRKSIELCQRSFDFRGRNNPFDTNTTLTIDSQNISSDSYGTIASFPGNIISFPNLISGSLSISSCRFLTEISLPNWESGRMQFLNSIIRNGGGPISFPKLASASVYFNTIEGQFTSVQFPELVYNFENFNLYVPTSTPLTSINFPKLKYITSSSASISLAGITNFSLPEVVFMQSSWSFGSWNREYVVTVNMPKLEYYLGSGSLFENAVTFPSLATANFPVLKATIGSITNNSNMNNLTSISFPELIYMGLPIKGVGASPTWAPVYTLSHSDAWIINSTGLTSISVPKIEFGTGVQMASTPNLASFTINQTPKLFTQNFVVTNAKLNQASVDGILAALAYMNGTANAPFPAYSSKTVNLSGGTSATPSAAGLASKAILVARGCTVTHN
jgi:hypothetical protein